MIKNFHSYIKELRKEREFSQAYMAKELDMSRPTYIDMEQGEREPTLSELKNLASIFGIPVANFLEENYHVPKISISVIKERKCCCNVPKAEKGSPDIRISVPQKNMEKFREVLLYILEKVGAKPNIGETVLYKLLYFIDFDYYEKYEEQLIGATYIKNKHGPTPVEFKKLVEQMKKNKELEVVNSKYFKYQQKKYLPLRSSNMGKLTALEKMHVDEVLKRLANKNARELSEYSHGDVPWIVHKSGEPISYESVFYRSDEYSLKDHSNDEL
jgi:transcriptional regulator with XRE-family HTH domain